MSCAKTAEPIEMQFAVLRRVGAGNNVLHGDARICSSREGALLRCLSDCKAS